MTDAKLRLLYSNTWNHLSMCKKNKKQKTNQKHKKLKLV